MIYKHELRPCFLKQLSEAKKLGFPTLSGIFRRERSDVRYRWSSATSGAEGNTGGAITKLS